MDVKDAVQARVATASQTAMIDFNHAAQPLKTWPVARTQPRGSPQTLVVIYSYGDFHAATKVVRSDEPGANLTIDRDSCVPATKRGRLLQKSVCRSGGRAHRAAENRTRADHARAERRQRLAHRRS